MKGKLEENNFLKDYLIITIIFLITSFILYGYYWFFTPYKLQLVYQNWDGPSYIVIAKSLYNNSIIRQVNTVVRAVGDNPIYFAAHLPLYPIFIRLFSFLGYWRSMLFTSQLFSLLFIFAFYQLSKLVNAKINPLFLSLPLIFITPRWFIVSHVGSSEPIFLFFLTLSLIFLIKQKSIFSAIFGSLAQCSRPQGALLFIGLMLYFLYFALIIKNKNWRKAIIEFLPYLLLPISLLLIFVLYYFQYGDFFAYFHAIEKYRFLQWPPFLIFSKSRVSFDIDIWQELIIFYYFIYISTVFLLFKQKLYNLAFVSLAFLAPIPFLIHVDIGREGLPLLPFIFIAYNKIISSKIFRIILILLIPAIYSFAVNFMNINLSP